MPIRTPLIDRPAGQSPPRSALGALLLNFKPVRKGTLCGFAVIRLPNGLDIHDVVIGEKHGRAGTLLPSKPMIDRDGNVMRDLAGKVRYTPAVEWSTPELREAFSRHIVELVRRAHPTASDPPDGEGSP